jgi:hypothetical protein
MYGKLGLLVGRGKKTTTKDSMQINKKLKILVATWCVSKTDSGIKNVMLS